MCIAPEKNVFERTLRAFDIVLKPRSAFKWFEQHENKSGVAVAIGVIVAVVVSSSMYSNRAQSHTFGACTKIHVIPSTRRQQRREEKVSYSS